ncbi:MAG: hypothetical protein IJM37_00845 [Lachnospiraceae bacterium]|nr:hypothetical protein [Lachnospiraceae bacterium]
MKKILFAVWILCLIFLSGCGKKENNDYSAEADNDSNVIFKNTEYNPDTDYQFFSSNYSEVTASDSIYYFRNYEFVYYWDKKSGQSGALCAKPDCSHDSESCDAYIGFAGNLTYNDGSLYYLEIDEDDASGSFKYTLHSRLPDGSVDKEISELMSSSNELPVIPETMIHRGYLYYVIYDGTMENSTSRLCRVPLDGSEDSKELFAYKGVDADIYQLKGYGDGVMFIVSEAADKDLEKHIFNIYYYDTASGQTELVVDDTRGDYVVINDKVYYTMPDAVYCYDVFAKNKEKFYETNALVYMSYDGVNLYLDDSYSKMIDDKENEGNTITVLSLDGEIIDSINNDNSQEFCFGDSEYLILGYDEDFKLLDKKYIGKDKTEWITWEIPHLWENMQ